MAARPVRIRITQAHVDGAYARWREHVVACRRCKAGLCTIGRIRFRRYAALMFDAIDCEKQGGPA